MWFLKKYICAKCAYLLPTLSVHLLKKGVFYNRIVFYTRFYVSVYKFANNLVINPTKNKMEILSKLENLECFFPRILFKLQSYGIVSLNSSCKCARNACIINYNCLLQCAIENSAIKLVLLAIKLLKIFF